MLKLTTDRHEASRCLFALAELLVFSCCNDNDVDDENDLLLFFKIINTRNFKEIYIISVMYE